LGDWQLTLAASGYLGIAVVVLLAVATFIGFATFLKVRVIRIESARLREEVRQLSEDVKHLVNAEQRRFLKELLSSTDEDASKTSE
jgi:hypothetical protein